MNRAGSTKVPRFNRAFGNADQPFSRIGGGALGGKAAGLLALRDRVVAQLDPGEFPYIEVTVPTLTVLTTDVYSTFVDRNGLDSVIASEGSDDRIAHAFHRAELPAEIVGDLRALVAHFRTPLAVRSSSLLEDALEHPFAGVYATKMIPNHDTEEDIRFSRLVDAIKFVYASTCFAASRAYLRSVGQAIDAEAMAVVVQEVVGQLANRRFYPCVSGVARSYNVYPTGNARPEDGVVSLALGLGKTIVDGGLSWSYSPRFPKAPPPFNDVGDLLKNTQTGFWAVHMGEPPRPDPVAETECMCRLGLADAEHDGALKYLASTYDPASDRLNPGLGGRGARALTFAPLVASSMSPFNDLILRLLEISEHELGSAVEIEFALSLDRRDMLPARFGLLQLRPMRVGGDELEIPERELSEENVVVASDAAMGHGERCGISDVVYLKPACFDPALTPRMAMDVDRINSALAAEGRHCVLIGFGRWGTSDPWLGVPVSWPQISTARVIVEASLENVNTEMSQGSHFFHNVLAFQVLYFSLRHWGPFGIDWAWLDSQPTVAETELVKHVRTRQPLTVKVDGAHRRGVVKRND